MSIRRVTALTLSALLLLASVTACSDEPHTASDAVAATEVTDRATLKAFVEGARDYLEGVTTVRGIAQLP